MIQLNKLFLLLLLSYFPIFSEAQQDLLNYKNSLKFARYLNITKQYDFAAEEYERLNFIWPNDTNIVLELVQTYRLNSQCEKFGSSLKLLSFNNRISTVPEYTKEYLRFSLNCKNNDPHFFDYVPLLSKNEETFYTLSHYWVNKQYELAFLFNKNSETLIKKHSPDLYALTNSFENEKFKKPGIALLMSTIIPGSGKAYSKRWGDALVSFVFVTTNAYLSYRAFNKRGVESVNGWFFGGMAFSFYTANIWGSFKSAKKYNETMYLRYQKNAENIIYNSY